MIENILRNTTKLVSQFLEFKCIFYDLYKLGCAAVVQQIVPERRTVHQGWTRASKHFARTNTDTNGRFAKTTNSSGVKSLEMIPGASRLQIKCGLFLWLSGDVGKLLQVLDVTCMVCVELDPIHGGGGHGWEVKLMGWPWEVGDFGYVLTTLLATSSRGSVA